MRRQDRFIVFGQKRLAVVAAEGEELAVVWSPPQLRDRVLDVRPLGGALGKCRPCLTGAVR